MRRFLRTLPGLLHERQPGDGRAGGFRRAEHGTFRHGQNRVVGREHQLELLDGGLEVTAAVGKTAAADH